MAWFLGLVVSRTDCRIHNVSNSTMKLIPKSYLDGAAAASPGMVREELVREIPPNGFIDVVSRKYDLNRINFNVHMRIHFVATNGGRVRLKDPKDDVRPRGVEAANLEPVFFHRQLRTYGEMYLTCVEGEEV
ncbi:hypothetical protein BT93_C1764 [Corymbia citriodora subsp. variegata]|nr:hypothetical protein BT93_C1764 [Corymbia citriodora subsp. variegata]